MTTKLGRSFGHFRSRLASDTRGVTLALVAASITALIGFTGLGVETGLWYAMKRQNQSAADVAAFSGAFELLAGQSAALMPTRLSGHLWPRTARRHPQRLYLSVLHLPDIHSCLYKPFVGSNVRQQPAGARYLMLATTTQLRSFWRSSRTRFLPAFPWQTLRSTRGLSRPSRCWTKPASSPWTRPARDIIDKAIPICLQYAQAVSLVADST